MGFLIWFFFLFFSITEIHYLLINFEWFRAWWTHCGLTQSQFIPTTTIHLKKSWFMGDFFFNVYILGWFMLATSISLDSLKRYYLLHEKYLLAFVLWFWNCRDCEVFVSFLLSPWIENHSYYIYFPFLNYLWKNKSQQLKLSL